MSKRTQGTALSKRRRRKAAAGGANVQSQAEAGYKSRAKREQELQRWAIRGIGALAVLLALILAVAFAFEQLIIPSQLVAHIGDESITVREFQQEYRLERNRLMLQINNLQSSGFDMQQLAQQEPYATWINEANVPDQLGLRVLNDMVDDRLLAREASSRAISVDEEALQRAIEDYFGYDPTEAALVGVEPTATAEPTVTPTPYVSPTPSPTPLPTAIPEPTVVDEDEDAEDAPPTVTPQPTVVEPTLSAQGMRDNFEETERNYRAYFDRAGVASETLDGLFTRNALEQALAADLVADGASVLYADLRHILVEDEETALSAIEALQAGESFAALARAISTDPGSSARGGELGEAFVGNYVTEFRRAVEGAEIGAIVGPVESEFGFHILQVRSKERRAGAEEDVQRERAREQALDELIDELREQHDDEITLLDNWLDHIPQS